jgi:translation initiation factor eIF-2B subunit beta
MVDPPYSTRNRSTIMDIARNAIIEEIIQLINDLEQSHSLIVENADNHINDNDIILTANYSDQLHEFLLEASKTKSFNVIVAESYPSLKGLEMANKLFKSGIKTTLISDSSIFSIMPKISKVLIGTRSVMANGGLISYNGVYNICLAAQTFSIPVIVISGCFKLTPMYPFDHETFNEQLSPDTIYNCKYNGDLSNITFNSPAYDYVPPEFISMFITDKGDFHPSYMYRLFNEFYSQQDFYL